MPNTRRVSAHILLFFFLLAPPLNAGQDCGKHGFRIDLNDVNHQGWEHFVVNGCKYDFYTGNWSRTAGCTTEVILSNNLIKNLFTSCSQYITTKLNQLAKSNRGTAGFFTEQAARLNYKEIAALGKLTSTAAHTAVEAESALAKAGGKFKSVAKVAKKLGPLGLVVTVCFIASDVRAEGPAMGVAKNVPGLDVVIEGNRTTEEVFKLINEWSEDEVNAQVKISHLVAGSLLEAIQGKQVGSPDPEKALECITDLYNGLQSSVYRRIANQPATNIDWTFMKQGHPYRDSYIQPKINGYFKCVATIATLGQSPKDAGEPHQKTDLPRGSSPVTH